MPVIGSMACLLCAKCHAKHYAMLQTAQTMQPACAWGAQSLIDRAVQGHAWADLTEGLQPRVGERPRALSMNHMFSMAPTEYLEEVYYILISKPEFLILKINSAKYLTVRSEIDLMSSLGVVILFQSSPLNTSRNMYGFSNKLSGIISVNIIQWCLATLFQQRKLVFEGWNIKETNTSYNKILFVFRHIIF